MMKCIWFIEAIMLSGLFLSSNLRGQDSWEIGIALGDAFCFPAPLTIHQSDQPEISLTARFATHSFQPPIYYAIQTSRYRDMKGWALELVHLKITLKNKIPDIQRFEVSHGFNLLTLLRCWDQNSFRWQIGAGVVLAHPENTVRNLKLSESEGIFNSGYYFAGPLFQLAVTKQLMRWSNLSFVISGKFTGAYCWIPIAMGHSNLALLNLHGLIGFAYTF